MAEYYLGIAGNEQKLNPISLTVNAQRQRQAKEARLASGVMVRDTVTVKRIFSFSWMKLPGITDEDGLGRDALKSLFEAGGTLSLRIPLENGSEETVSVLFDNVFDEHLVRRVPVYFWDVSFGLVEV